MRTSSLTITGLCSHRAAKTLLMASTKGVLISHHCHFTRREAGDKRLWLLWLLVRVALHASIPGAHMAVDGMHYS